MVAPTSTFTWSGIYAGGNFGGGWGRTPFDSYLSNGTLDFTSSYNSSGVFGGGQIGINFMVAPEVLFGFEADGDWSNIAGNSPGCTATGCCDWPHYGQRLWHRALPGGLCLGTISGPVRHRGLGLERERN